MNFDIIRESLPEFINGAWLTGQLLLISLVCGLLLSVILAAMRTSGKKFLNLPALAFTYTFRGTPLLVQMYLIYYGFGQFTWVQETPWLWAFFGRPYFCALFALTLNNAGYTAEILYNAAIRLPKDELEASHAFNMSRWTIFRRLIVPTITRLSVQAYSNEVIFMLHATALVSLITLVDITGVARMVYARYYAPFEAFLVAGVFYLVLTLLITVLFRFWEKRIYRHQPA